VFSSADLATDDALLARFYKLYGDLLQIRSHKLLDALLADGPVGQSP
jgi:hypothetical protein